MLHKTSDKPRGYDYPNPSIASGQTQPAKHGTPKPLSGENVEKLRQSVRDQPPKKSVHG